MDAPPPTLRARPHLEQLADRLNPATGRLDLSGVIVGPDDGGPPVLHLIDRTGTTTELTVFDDTFRGGVRSAVGDITGDGLPDLVVAAGPGGGPHVKVYDGSTGQVVRSFFAFAPTFTGGVEVAVGDVTRDGIDDILVGAGPGGGPHARVFSGRTGTVVREVIAFDTGFRGGVFVAAGDLDVDGFDDIIVGAGAGGGPRVIAIDAQTGETQIDFFPFEPAFRGGARVASADVNGDGVDDLITAAGPGGGPRVKVYDVSRGTLLSDRFVADPGHRNGVRVSTAVASQQNGRVDVIAHTRSGDQADAVLYGVASASPDWTYSVWLGGGDPPADFFPTINFLPPGVSGSINPILTLAGPVVSVASDGSAVTIQRGDGTPITIDLNGDDPPPAGQVSIDTVQLPPATVWLADEELPATDLPVGRWVRVRVARAVNPSATQFTALDARVL